MEGCCCCLLVASNKALHGTAATGDDLPTVWAVAGLYGSCVYMVLLQLNGRQRVMTTMVTQLRVKSAQHSTLAAAAAFSANGDQRWMPVLRTKHSPTSTSRNLSGSSDGERVGREEYR